MSPVDHTDRPDPASVEPVETPARRRIWPLVALGVLISLLLAAIVSFYASSAPDGLNKVAEDIGFGQHAQDSAAADSPVADYEASWIADDRLAVAVAGIVGVVLTGALAFTLFLWLGRRNPADPAQDPTAESGAAEETPVEDPAEDTTVESGAVEAHDPSSPTPR